MSPLVMLAAFCATAGCCHAPLVSYRASDTGYADCWQPATGAVCPPDASAGCLPCPPRLPFAHHLSRLFYGPGEEDGVVKPPWSKFHPVPVRPVFAPVAAQPSAEPPALEPVPAPTPQTPLTLR